jgi:hypothetical protein
LHRSTHTKTIENAAGFLKAQRNADAGWAYLPGNESASESTCYAALALHGGERRDDAELQTLAWIARHAENGSSEPLWTKALSLLTLSGLGARPELRTRLRQFLLSVGGKPLPSTKDLNSELRGWSWIEGTFSWVEPTSYALLALKKTGDRTHPRILEGERLLLDRVCSDGGWNYGNRKVREIALTFMAPTTALAAMALQGAPESGTVVQRALDLLDREVARRPSSLSLALTILCFDVYRRPHEHLTDLLIGRQEPDGSWRGQSHLTSLSVLAVRTQEQFNVFAI